LRKAGNIEVSSEIPDSNPSTGETPAASRERPYAGKTPEERRADRRTQLIEAGLELFGTVGFRDTTIERLCAVAGVGIRAFYDEFGTRADLLRHVYDHVVDQAFVRLTTALEESALVSAVERLDCGIRVFFDSMLIDPRRGQIVSIECSGLDAAMDIHRNNMMKKFAGTMIGALTPEQRDAVVDTRLWSIMLGGAANEVVIDWLVSKEKPDIDALADNFMAIWLSTFRA